MRNRITIYKEGKEEGFKCRKRYTWGTSHDPRPSFESFTCFVQSPEKKPKSLKLYMSEGTDMSTKRFGTCFATSNY